MRQQVTPEQIKALRAKLALTQEQLAHSLNVTFYSVNRWESGTVKPSPLAVAAIRHYAASQGIDVDKLGVVVKITSARRKRQ